MPATAWTPEKAGTPETAETPATNVMPAKKGCWQPQRFRDCGFESAALRNFFLMFLRFGTVGHNRREIIVRGQSYGWRLPKYWPPTPSPPGECVPPAYGAGGGHTR